jgi:hypothetical protein
MYVQSRVPIVKLGITVQGKAGHRMKSLSVCTVKKVCQYVRHWIDESLSKERGHPSYYWLGK